MGQGIATAEAGIDQTLGISRFHELLVVVSGALWICQESREEGGVS